MACRTRGRGRLPWPGYEGIGFGLPREDRLDASDAELVRRCLAGERVAWSALLARYGDLVYGMAHRAGHDAAGRADVFQEVSILLWKSLPRLRRTDTLAPWLATTTKRVAWRVSKRARARRGREAERARAEAAPDAGPDDVLAAAEEEQAVRRGLDALGERCRRLLRALYFDVGSPSYDEVADRLGIPRGSIGPTRQRCLEKLREELVRAGWAAPDVSDKASAASTPGREEESHRGRR